MIEFTSASNHTPKICGAAFVAARAKAQVLRQHAMHRALDRVALSALRLLESAINRAELAVHKGIDRLSPPARA